MHPRIGLPESEFQALSFGNAPEARFLQKTRFPDKMMSGNLKVVVVVVVGSRKVCATRSIYTTPNYSQLLPPQI